MDNLPVTLAKVFDLVYGADIIVNYSGPDIVYSADPVKCQNCLVRDIGPDYFHWYYYDVKSSFGYFAVCNFCHFTWYKEVRQLNSTK